MQYIYKNTDFSPYLLVPKFLRDVPLTDSAVQVYVLLLDRTRMGFGDPRWQDEKGRAFTIYTIRQLAEDTKKTERTVKSALKLLRSYELIERVRIKGENVKRIYVMLPDRGNPLPHAEESSFTPQGKSVSQAMGKNCPANKNNRIKTMEQKGYGPCGNVMLTEEQVQRLTAVYPNIGGIIDRMSRYLAASGKTYPDYEEALRSWVKRSPESYLSMSYDCEEGESL